MFHTHDCSSVVFAERRCGHPQLRPVVLTCRLCREMTWEQLREISDDPEFLCNKEIGEFWTISSAQVLAGNLTKSFSVSLKTYHWVPQ